MSSDMEKYTSKEDFLKSFQDLYMENSLPIGYSEKNKKRIREETTPVKTKSSMFASIPMLCRAEKCSFAETCPLQIEGIAPKGSPCPYEMAMVAQFSAAYMEQLNIEPDNIIEVSIVRNIVDQDVQYLRANKFLAKESFIQENVVGIDANGEVIMKKELHLAIELQEKMVKRHSLFLKQLLATRESKAKVGMGTMDTAQTMANLMGEFRKLQSQAEKVHLKKLGFTDDYDEFIEEGEIIDVQSDE